VGASRTSRIPAFVFTSVMSAVLAASTGGCAGGSLPASRPHSLSPSALSAADREIMASRSAPLPRAVARKLGKGFIYLLAGPKVTDFNVWVIGGGTERQLTFGSNNDAVSAGGAAAAGIVVSDDQFNADDLAKVTTRGIWWLPAGKTSRLHQASSPTISAHGQVAFTTVPDAKGYPVSKHFELRIQNGFTRTSRIIYASPTPLFDPAFGPANQIAFIRQPKASDYNATTVMLRSTDGHVRSLKTGFAFPDDLVWSANAPDLVVATWPLKAEAINRHGKRTHLPDGWFPMAWNPAGTKLLVTSATKIGLWAPAHPATVRVIGPLTHGIEAGTASWLKRRASLSVPSAPRS
jgi:hypothetical protein